MSDCVCNTCKYNDSKKIREEIDGYMFGMNLDELKVLAYTAKGLANGRKVYGALDAKSDKRNMPSEALEEVRDALVYVGTRLVQLEQ